MSSSIYNGLYYQSPLVISIQNILDVDKSCIKKLLYDSLQLDVNFLKRLSERRVYHFSI